MLRRHVRSSFKWADFIGKRRPDWYSANTWNNDERILRIRHLCGDHRVHGSFVKLDVSGKAPVRPIVVLTPLVSTKLKIDEVGYIGRSALIFSAEDHRVVGML